MKINSQSINTDHTSYVGEIFCSFDTLVATFGEPILLHGDHKTDAIWNIEFDDGSVAAIYNWRGGISGGLPVTQNMSWHIGGEQVFVTIYVAAFIFEATQELVPLKQFKTTAPVMVEEDQLFLPRRVVKARSSANQK